MNILCVTQYYFPEPFKIHEICEELVEQGHTVTVVTARPNYPEGNIYQGYENEGKEIINGVTVHRCKAKPRGNSKVSLLHNYISFPHEAHKLLKKMKTNFDMVYVYQLSPIFMLYPAIKVKKRLQIPMVCYVLDLWPESLNAIHITKKSLIYGATCYISNKLYKHCDKVIATSEGFVKYLKEINKIEESKIEVIHQHGESMFLNIAEKKEIVPYILTFAGNIGNVQGLDALVDAIDLLEESYKAKLEVRLIGNGSYKETLRSSVKQKRLENVIKFYDRMTTSQLYSYYEDSDALLLTLSSSSDLKETIPSKFQTYLSIGRPIIASINGITNALLKDIDCGYVCEAENCGEMASAIRTFMDDNSSIHRTYGNHAKTYFIQNYTIHNHVEKLIKTMEAKK